MISPISAEAFPTNKNRPCLNPTEAPVQQHRKGQTLLTPHPCCGGRSCSGWPWNISRCTRSRLTVDNQGLWSLHHLGFHVWNDKSKFLLDLNNTRFFSCFGVRIKVEHAEASDCCLALTAATKAALGLKRPTTRIIGDFLMILSKS